MRMGGVMGFFDKKYCDIYGDKIALMGKRRILI